MAINNWRATYDPDYIMSQINSLASWTKTPAQVRAEDRAYVSSQSAPVWTVPQSVSSANRNATYFPRAEAYWLQAQWYANQWNQAMANAYGNIANNLWRYSNFANTSLNSYDALLNYLQQNETWLQNVAWKTYNTLVGDIQNQRDYINRMFGPDGELTREVNTYYDDLWNYLATDAGRQAANIAAQWMHSWASLWAIRAQQNEAYNQSFWRYIQAKEQQINAKQQIASNLINYMSTLRQEYWDTTNQYIIELYKRANDMYNSVAQSAMNDINQYNKLRASGAGASTPSTVWWHLDAYGNWVDANWNIIYTAEELNNMANKTTEPIYWPYVNNPYTNATANAQKATYWLDDAIKTGFINVWWASNG